MPESDDPVTKMAHRLSTKNGRLLYGLRKQTVEPVFGIIKRVMGWSQMSMRGLAKARGELYIGCAEHDELAPAPMVEALQGLFTAAGSPGELSSR